MSKELPNIIVCIVLASIVGIIAQHNLPIALSVVTYLVIVNQK
jgi:hypothetical protein